MSVRGLARCEVTNETIDGYEGSDIEFALGFFFTQHCRSAADEENNDSPVLDVVVMADPKKPPKKSICRGFAYIDFRDEESMGKALALNGTTDTGDVFLDPKINKLIIERARPQRESEVAATPPSDPQKQVQRQKQVQLEDERARTTGLEQELRLTVNRINDVMAEIERHQNRQKALENNSIEEALKAEKQQQQKLIDMRQDMQDQEVRLAAMLRAEESRTRALEKLVGEMGIEAVAVEDPENASEESSSTVRETIASTQAKALLASITGDREECAPPEPLKRGSSVASTQSQREWAKGKNRDVSYAILKQKQESFEATKNETRPRWAEIDDGDDWERDDWEKDSQPKDSSPEELTPLHKVQISNLPPLDAKTLEKDLRNVVAHFLEVHGLPSEDYEIVDVEIDGAGENASYAARLSGGKRKKECKAVISFRDAADASFLKRKICEKGNLSLGGQVLSACLMSEVADRLLHDVEPSDISSMKSYRTAGTAASAQNDRAGSGNRTIVFEGIPTDIKIYDVKDAVKRMVLRSYQSAGYRFEESTMLHGGNWDSALDIPRNKKSENDGIARLRLRYPRHAEWLVKQKKVPLCGSSVMVKWAQTRDFAATAAAGEVSEVMKLPRNVRLGQIVGPGGATVKKLVADSGCKISLEGNEVRFRGTRESIAKARQMISDIIGPMDGKGGKGKGSGKLGSDCAERVQELGLYLSSEAEIALASLPKTKAMGILNTIEDKLKRGEEIKNPSGYVISSVKNDKESSGQGKRY